jgi:hypothetical protein
MSGRATDPILRAAFYAAAFAAGVFLLVGAFKVGDLTTAIYQDPDHASTPVIAQFFGSRGSGEVTLGNYPWLEPLFVERWTRGLPDHRTVWEVGPFILYLAAAAAVGWTVGRTGSRPAGLFVTLALLVPAAPVIFDLAAPALRGTSFAHTALLSAFLVALPRLARARAAWLAIWAAGLALTLAPGVASDPVLLLAWGVVPFLVAVVIGWRLGILPDGAAAWAAAGALVGTALGYVLEKIAEHHEIVYFHLHYELASISKVPTNARLLLENVATFVHGRFQTPFASTRGIEWVVAALAVVGIPVLCLLIARRLPAMLTGSERRPEARLLAAFWATSLAATVAVFLLPITPVVIDVGSLRYVTALWPALLVLAALSWGARVIPWLAVLVVATAALGSLELFRGDYAEGGAWLSDEEVSGATRFVEANDLSHGYAGYRDASPLTYASDFKVKSYPVNMCGSATPIEARCQFSLHTMDAWYRPIVPRARTFYVWDDRPLAPDVSIAPPPRSWGRPFATARFGHLHLYAYGYDLARHVRPPV